MTKTRLITHEEKEPSLMVLFLRFFFLLLLTYSVGYIGGSFVTPEAMLWYDGLILSDFNPPDSWFGIAWALLYFLMAFSAWIVWGKVTPRPFVLQLIFNLLWPFFFFHLKMPILALIDVILMIVFVLCTIIKFGRVSAVAGWLMIPLLLWSIFALYLNMIVVLYNTQVGVWFGII